MPVPSSFLWPLQLLTALVHFLGRGACDDAQGADRIEKITERPVRSQHMYMIDAQCTGHRPELYVVSMMVCRRVHVTRPSVPIMQASNQPSNVHKS